MYGSQVADQSTSSIEVLADLQGPGVCMGHLLSSILFAVSVGASVESSLESVNRRLRR